MAPGVACVGGGGSDRVSGARWCTRWLRDFDEAFPETRYEYSQIRDLGDRVVGIGHLWARGKESGVETDSPLGYVVDFRGGKATQVRTYLDHNEALEAAGLSE